MDIAAVFRALRFAADKHRTQRRKDATDTPFINHLIDVAEILAGAGGIDDSVILQAALLHDALEDTDATAAEIEQAFGPQVLRLVEELTEDRSLRRAVRKQQIIDRAPRMSPAARQIKIADMVSNLRSTPMGDSDDWPLRFRREYVDFAEKVFAGCRGVNPKLDELFAQTLAATRECGL